ncbi:response regulator transcription factor [Mucilaginibacter sp. ZT4R22]|uniref:Response regulator transcription factor n=1 Tax=Mucilaginibacter pankratovii TaxID=2772110 RepID=A0ABR7WML8_9SPHI|nr:response regulator [Mucilaginibacter pankratovii]MBD1363408.1 response regulator transcription factor [Mucilaginibacter pankratovii]
MNKRILIVDDNELITEIMSYILTNNGYDVTTLNTGYNVVAQINLTLPHLVIMDITLPGVDGRDICRIIKHNKATKNLPVIICSGNDDIELALKQEGPPNDILPKPFDMTVLLNKVEYQLAA